MSYFLSFAPLVLPVKILMALRDEVKLALHTAAPLLSASKLKFQPSRNFGHNVLVAARRRQLGATATPTSEVIGRR